MHKPDSGEDGKHHKEMNQKKKNETARKRYHRLKASGICPRCVDKAEPGRVFCTRCQSIQNESSGKTRTIRKERGLCIKCGCDRGSKNAVCDDCERTAKMKRCYVI